MDFCATQDHEGQDHLIHPVDEAQEAEGKAAPSLYLYHYMNFYFK